ncbi:MAG: ROK family protein [Anaerolineaceae bacterium]
MIDKYALIKPRIQPPLDRTFLPAVLAYHAYQKGIEREGIPLVIGLERSEDDRSRYMMRVLPREHPNARDSLFFVERVVKFLLWQRGGHKLLIGGPGYIGDYIHRCYSPGGRQKFDSTFMGEKVYKKPFSVVKCESSDVPDANDKERILGRHLDGYRIGFDLGASDLKVSAVANGKVVYSQEIVWEPRNNADPEYHYKYIIAALKEAASKMPRVDAIGGSSAGIYMDSRPMVASIFRNIPEARFGEIRNLFQRIREEMGVPLEVINDGDVTALAGSMAVEDNGILGIAMGSSQAAGYVNMNGRIMSWLNELSFAPIDYSPSAPLEEWSGDHGCGSSYFSQQCVFRLAPLVGIDIPDDLPDTEKLKNVQLELESGHEGTVRIWQSMGVYLGYGLAHYADFYDIKHVLILGRCTSGHGGELILDGVQNVMRAEFPDLADRIQLHLPDDKMRRLGQSFTAASLPNLGEH